MPVFKSVKLFPRTNCSRELSLNNIVYIFSCLFVFVVCFVAGQETYVCKYIFVLWSDRKNRYLFITGQKAEILVV